jgi:hypothetical protein
MELNLLQQVQPSFSIRIDAFGDEREHEEVDVGEKGMRYKERCLRSRVEATELFFSRSHKHGHETAYPLSCRFAGLPDIAPEVEPFLRDAIKQLLGTKK